MPQSIRTTISPLSCVIIALAALGATVPARAEEPARKRTLETQRRRPIALVMAGERLVVGNRQSGSITVIDTSAERVLAEHAVAKRIADMTTLDGERHLAVLDDAAGKLWKVSLDARGESVREIAGVPSTSVKLAVARERRRLFITAAWSRQVVSITFDDAFEIVTQRETTRLPFAPRELLLVNGDRNLLVADAFGGGIAVLDAVRLRTLSIRRVDGHNIRGLALDADGERLHVAHQRIPDRALADYEELHWGRIVTNGVRVLSLRDVLAAETDQPLSGWLYEHGGIGGATGDPGGVVTGATGVTAVAFSGVGEVAIRRKGYETRVVVGAGPEAMAIHRDRLYVANRFDDSVSVIDLGRGIVVETMSLGPAPELTAVERGEKLFFDARLSHDGWISCHSCHTDGHSAGLLVDTLGDGDYGAPKRVPSLLGTRDAGPWGWTGKAASLADQVRSSVATTLHGDPLSESETADLVAYLESLEPPPPPATEKRRSVARGEALFSSRGCVDCHTPPTFTSDSTFHVGFVDERNRRLFNPPSLRGVSQRGRLFHDGRAKTLEDVLLRFRHQLEAPLSKEESAALLAYLRSL